MSEYETRLEEIREHGRKTCRVHVQELFIILTDGEGKEPAEARKILEHDLGDIYSKRRILECLPDAVKDQKQQEAGKQKGKIKAEIITLTNKGSAAEPQLNNPDPSLESGITTYDPKADTTIESNQKGSLMDEVEYLTQRLTERVDELSQAKCTIEGLEAQLESKDKELAQFQLTPALKYKPQIVQWPETDNVKVWTMRNVHIDYFRKRLGEIKALLNGKEFIDVCVMKVDPFGEMGDDL